MEAVKILFFAAVFLSVYSYIFYPIILFFLNCIYRVKTICTDNTPPVTLIISVYNEEDIIEEKIKNSLMLNYPKNKLEIMVVSDHSTDKTDDIIRSYVKDVTLLAHNLRRGKTAGLNDAVRKAKGDVVIFSDADSMYEPNAINEITKLLGDPNVGLVTGSTKYIAEGNGEMIETSSIYTRLELLIKHLESNIGSCVGADGAIFGMRKTLYEQLSNDDINDFVIPLKVVSQGYRVVLHDNLFCVEAASASSSGEFRRQIRITNRTLRALFRHLHLMNFFKYPLFSFELVSHKLIRFSAPLFILVLIPLNTILIREGSLYKVAFAVQILFYCAALIGYLMERQQKDSGLFGIIYHFLMVNISILLGWFEFLSGNKQITWDVS